MLKINSRNSTKVSLFKMTLLCLTFPVFGACALQEKTMTSGLEFREARFAEITAMREFRKCNEEGKTLDRKAKGSGRSAAFLTSAKILEQCETEIGPGHQNLATEERMQAYGLAIQNYVKGRDVISARNGLKRFKKKFPNKDFYYPDGTSFIQTMETLIGLQDRMSYGQFSSLNVSKTLKSEMRRLHYWKNK